MNQKYYLIIGIVGIIVILGIISINHWLKPNIPSQDNYEIFDSRKEMIDYFIGYKSEKTEQLTPSAMIAIRPEKTCDSNDDCLLVSNYFHSSRVNCKIDPDAPGDWMPCPIPGESSASPRNTQSSTESPQGYLPEAGDPRYQWSERYYPDCLNPTNLNESERDDLEIEEGHFSTLRKCSCLTLAEHYQEPSIGGETEGEGRSTALPGSGQAPPPTSTGPDDTVEMSTYEASPQKKYCLLLRKTSNLIVSNIDVPDHPLKSGKHSFDMTIKNLGPDKCCETYQITEFFKDEEYWGGIGLHRTLECWAFPDGDGILMGQSIESATGFVDFNEAGNYTIKANIKCLMPEEGNINNGLFEADIQIE